MRRKIICSVIIIMRSPVVWTSWLLDREGVDDFEYRGIGSKIREDNREKDVDEELEARSEKTIGRRMSMRL